MQVTAGSHAQCRRPGNCHQMDFFRSHDLSALESTPKQAVIFDCRNLFNPPHMAKERFEYYIVGRKKLAFSHNLSAQSF
jgi:hypothetical protein